MTIWGIKFNAFLGNLVYEMEFKCILFPERRFLLQICQSCIIAFAGVLFERVYIRIYGGQYGMSTRCGSLQTAIGCCVVQ